MFAVIKALIAHLVNIEDEKGYIDPIYRLWELQRIKLTHFVDVRDGSVLFRLDSPDVGVPVGRHVLPQVPPRHEDAVIVGEVLHQSTHRHGTVL